VLAPLAVPLELPVDDPLALPEPLDVEPEPLEVPEASIVVPEFGEHAATIDVASKSALESDAWMRFIFS
jgi:hypothetical protein